MSNKQEPSIFGHVWDFFCSLKLAISTLILLATTSIIGTVLPQTATPQENLQRFGEARFKLFDALDFFDMYHSWWFITLLAVFALNLICCSIKRLPVILKLVRNPNLTPEDKFFKTLANGDEAITDAAPEVVRDKLVNFVGKGFAAPQVHVDGEKIHLFAQKMAWARFGVYVVHISILVIFIGAIVGSFWGYKAYVNILEGTSIKQVWPRGSQTALPIDFEVRCDDFRVEFYTGTSRPREFSSDLVVLENGQEILKKTIEVNDPLSYKGLTFYQSSYGPAGDPAFTMMVTQRSSGQTMEIKGRQGEHVTLPGGQSFAVTNYTDSYKNFGPAIQMHVNGKDGKHGSPFLVFQNFAEFDSQRGGDFIFALKEFNQSYYTGLQVAKDPGVWVVWVGCFLMVTGCFAAFFLSHRRIWLTIQPVDGKTRVLFGGNAHRNQPAFEIFFDDFRQKLKAELVD